MSRRSPSIMFARLMVALLALCFVSELPRLLIFAHASPTPHLARREPLRERGFMDLTLKGLNASHVAPDILKILFPPRPTAPTPSPAPPTMRGTAAINQVAHHAAKEIQFNLDFDRIKEAFTASYALRDQSGDPATVDERWIAKQMTETIPNLKKTLEDGLKKASNPGRKRDVVLALHKNPTDQGPETSSDADLDVTEEALSNYVLEALATDNMAVNLTSEKTFAAERYEEDHKESPVEAVQRWVNETFDNIIPDEVRGLICEHVGIEWHELASTTSHRDVSAWPDKMKKVIGEYWVSRGAYILELYSSRNTLPTSASPSSKTSTSPPTMVVTSLTTGLHPNSSATLTSSMSDPKKTTSLASVHSTATQATSGKLHARQTATPDPKVELKDLFWNTPEKRSNGRAHAFDIQGQQAHSKASVSRVHSKRDFHDVRSFTTLASSPYSDPSPSQQLENSFEERDAEAKKGGSGGKKGSAPAAKAASSAPSKPTSKATSAAPETSKASSHKAAATSSAHSSKTSSHKESATSSADSKESEKEAPASSSSHSKTASASGKAKAKATAALGLATDAFSSFQASQKGEEGTGGAAGTAGKLASSAWDSHRGRKKHGSSAHSSAAAEEEAMASEVAADETTVEEEAPVEESTGSSHSSKLKSHGRSGKGRGKSSSTHSSSNADISESEVVEESPESETEIAAEEQPPASSRKKTSSHGTSKKGHGSATLERLTRRAAMVSGDKRPASPDQDEDPSTKRTRVEDRTGASGNGAAVASSPGVSGGGMGATGPGNSYGDSSSTVPVQGTSEGTSGLGNTVGGAVSQADGSASAAGASPASNSAAGSQDVPGTSLGSSSVSDIPLSSPRSHGSAAPGEGAGPAAKGDTGYLAGSDYEFSAGSSGYSTDRDTSDVSTSQPDHKFAGDLGNSGASASRPTSSMSVPSLQSTAASNDWSSMNNLRSYYNKHTNTLNSASPVAESGDYAAENHDDDWGITAESDSYLKQSPNNPYLSSPKIAGGDNYAANGNSPADLDHTGEAVSKPKGPSIFVTSPGGPEPYAAEVAHWSEDGLLLPPPMDSSPYSMAHHDSAPVPSTAGAIASDSANAVPTTKANVAGTSLPAAQPSGTVLRILARRSARAPLEASDQFEDEGSSGSGSGADGGAGDTDYDMSSTLTTDSTASMDEAGSYGDDTDSSEAPEAPSAGGNDSSASEITASGTTVINPSASDALSGDMSATDDSQTPSDEEALTLSTSSSDESPAGLLEQASSLVSQAIKALSGGGSDGGDPTSYPESPDSVGSTAADVDSSISSSSSSYSDLGDEATADMSGAATDSGLDSSSGSASSLGDTTDSVSSGAMGGDVSGATGGMSDSSSSLDSNAGSTSSSARAGGYSPSSLDAADPMSSGFSGVGGSSLSMSDTLSGSSGADSSSSPPKGSVPGSTALDNSDTISSGSSISDSSTANSDMSGTTAIDPGSDSMSSSTTLSVQGSGPAATAPDASDPRLAHSLSTGPGDATSIVSDSQSGTGGDSNAGSGSSSAAGSRSSPSSLGASKPVSSDPLGAPEIGTSTGMSDSLTGTGSISGAGSGPLPGSGSSSGSASGSQSGALSGGAASLP